MSLLTARASPGLEEKRASQLQLRALDVSDGLCRYCTAIDIGAILGLLEVHDGVLGLS